MTNNIYSDSPEVAPRRCLLDLALATATAGHGGGRG